MIKNIDKNISELEVLRHSTSHIMASAVKELFPEARLGIGPSIEDGFYYDFYLEKKLTIEDLPKIEQKMQEIINKNYSFEREELTKEDATKLFSEKGEKFKLELISEISDEKVSIYKHDGFIDLCRGPHFVSTGAVKHFKLLSIAGAYWRGDEKREQLQRIYGTVFNTKQELDEYLTKLEEAKKRDHRKLGRELELFDIYEEEFGSGLVFWLPKGAIVRKLIEDYLKDFHLKNGYKLIYTPHIAKSSLWQTSGHLSFYSENMFSEINVEGQDYIIKPMNCPGHILIYKSQIRSYRDLPIRLFELGTVYRYERSGVLHGLMRVRGFTQDDAHIFCTKEQLETEILGLLETITKFLRKFGFNEYGITLSTRPKDSIGEKEVWDLAQDALKNSLEKSNLGYEIDEGGGAFYGPKIDLKIKDAIGRLWQCSTIQVDFNLPNRFDVRYRSSEGKDEYVIMIHRALLGSLERFFGVLIEHYAGVLPLWLAPVQIKILPISDKFNDYAEKIRLELETNGFRAEVDNLSNTLQYKIRSAVAQKIHYLIILGEKEVSENFVSVRKYNEKNTEKFFIQDFVEKLKKETLNNE
ncbi:MAG: threonine--tRNA ligase [Endomicrobiia bacterium]